jgi:hypothetical protein
MIKFFQQNGGLYPVGLFLSLAVGGSQFPGKPSLMKLKPGADQGVSFRLRIGKYPDIGGGGRR